MKALAVLFVAVVVATAGCAARRDSSTQPGFDEVACEAAAAQYRELAAIPLPTEKEGRAYIEERSKLFAARGAALHDYAEACGVGSYGQQAAP
jgi:hypothetical protein